MSDSGERNGTDQGDEQPIAALEGLPEAERTLLHRR